jgi:hypothetical protein
MVKNDPTKTPNRMILMATESGVKRRPGKKWLKTRDFRGNGRLLRLSSLPYRGKKYAETHDMWG